MSGDGTRALVEAEQELPHGMPNSTLWRAMRALQPHDVQVLESTDGVRAVVRVTLRAPAYLPRPLRGKLVRLIVKYIPEDREAANMIEAEQRASVLLPETPLLLPQLLMSSGDGQGTLMVSHYGGQSAEDLVWSDDWQDSSAEERLPTAKRFIACVALALHQMHTLPTARGGPCIYRDLKLPNVVYDGRSGLFGLIDFGLMVSADGQNFFSGLSMPCLPVELAAMDARSGSCVLLGSAEVQRRATSTAIDADLLGLAALRLLRGGVLPFEVNYSNPAYQLPRDVSLVLPSESARCAEEEQRTGMYAAAVVAWRRGLDASSPDLACAGTEGAAVLAALLHEDPSRRMSVGELLAHPWIADEVADVCAQLADAAATHSAMRVAVRAITAQLSQPTLVPAQLSQPTLVPAQLSQPTLVPAQLRQPTLVACHCRSASPDSVGVEGQPAVLQADTSLTSGTSLASDAGSPAATAGSTNRGSGAHQVAACLVPVAFRPNLAGLFRRLPDRYRPNMAALCLS